MWKVAFLYFFFNICFVYSQNKPIHRSKLFTSDRRQNGETTCGHQDIIIQSRIFGGKTAEIGEFPWMARLYYKKGRTKTFGCSGFLISQKVVLTAAHCIKSEAVNTYGPLFEVHLGEHDTRTVIDCDSTNTTCSDKVQVFRVKKAIMHPSYKVNSEHVHNDIALINLKKGAKISRYVSPICLVKKHDFTPIEYWLSGWGDTENGNQSDVKMKVFVPPFPANNCTKLFKKYDIKIVDTQICAGGRKNEDSCTGDSGGPLMVVNDEKWFAAGIVSYGNDCGKKHWPGVYTNVTSFYDWIERTSQDFENN